MILRVMIFFPDFRTPLAEFTNKAIDALIVGYGDFFQSVSNILLGVLRIIEQGLRDVPPPLMIALVAVLAYMAGRRVWLVVGVAAGLWLIGALGMWDEAMQTLAIVLVSVGISIVIGLPIGILSASAYFLRQIITPVLDLMQTIPSFVYLIPAAMLFGLGKVPAILATIVYATPPLIRLTELGIRQVDKEIIEAGRAFGATRLQILTRIQLPLALPSIMQGVNQTTMLALSMVVVASMIGARGVGEIVLLGLQRNDSGMGLVGGMTIVILAVIIDRMTQAYGRRLQQHRRW
jgi:glycine betaine/proline transport system permease protein